MTTKRGANRDLDITGASMGDEPEELQTIDGKQLQVLEISRASADP